MTRPSRLAWAIPLSFLCVSSAWCAETKIDKLWQKIAEVENTVVLGPWRDDYAWKALAQRKILWQIVKSSDWQSVDSFRARWILSQSYTDKWGDSLLTTSREAMVLELATRLTFQPRDPKLVEILEIFALKMFYRQVFPVAAQKRSPLFRDLCQHRAEPLLRAFARKKGQQSARAKYLLEKYFDEPEEVESVVKYDTRMSKLGKQFPGTPYAFRFPAKQRPLSQTLRIAREEKDDGLAWFCFQCILNNRYRSDCETREKNDVGPVGRAAQCTDTLKVFIARDKRFARPVYPTPFELIECSHSIFHLLENAYNETPNEFERIAADYLTLRPWQGVEAVAGGFRSSLFREKPAKVQEIVDRIFDRAYKNVKKDKQAPLRLAHAWCYYRMSHETGPLMLPHAAKHATRVVNDFPKSTESLLALDLLGLTYLWLDKPADAKKSFAQLARQKPGSTHSTLGQFELALLQSTPKDQKTALEKITLDPKADRIINVLCLSNLAKLYADSHQWAKAHKAHCQLVEHWPRGLDWIFLFPNSWGPYPKTIALRRHFVIGGRHRQMVKRLMPFRAHDFEDLTLWRKAQQEKTSAKKIQYLEKLVATFPTSPLVWEARVQWGRQLELQNDRKKAINVYEMLLSKNPPPFEGLLARIGLARLSSCFVPEIPKATREQENELATLIQLLKNKNFQVRLSASKKIRQRNHLAYPLLLAASKGSDSQIALHAGELMQALRGESVELAFSIYQRQVRKQPLEKVDRFLALLQVEAWQSVMRLEKKHYPKKKTDTWLIFDSEVIVCSDRWKEIALGRHQSRPMMPGIPKALFLSTREQRRLLEFLGLPGKIADQRSLVWSHQDVERSEDMEFIEYFLCESDVPNTSDDEDLPEEKSADQFVRDVFSNRVCLSDVQFVSDMGYTRAGQTVLGPSMRVDYLVVGKKRPMRYQVSFRGVDDIYPDTQSLDPVKRRASQTTVPKVQAVKSRP